MPKRTLAALLALLVAASTLAVVAQPAAAHSQTTTKQRCSYDPFAGRQCWTETVTVAHTHSCGAGMTGTYPNCYPAPSDNSQNTGDEEAKKRAEEARKAAEDEAKRKAEEEAKKKAEEEAKRKAEEEAKKKAEEEAKKKAEEEAKKKAETVTCTAGHHHFGNGCHIHGFTPPADQCGTGKTWAPHAGHTPIALPACKTTTIKPCSSYQGPLSSYERHRHPIGDNTSESACHRHDDSHCPAGQTETGAHGAQNCRENDAPDSLAARLKQIGDLISTGTSAALSQARAMYEAIIEANGESAVAQAEIRAAGGEEITRAIEDLWDKIPPEGQAAIEVTAAMLGCGLLIYAASKTTVATGGAAAAGWVQWLRTPTAVSYLDRTCNAAVTVGATAIVVRVIRNSDGSDSDSDSDSDGQQTNDPRPAPDDDTEPEVPTKKQMVDKNDEIQKKKDAGTLTPEERAEWQEMHRRYTCATNLAVQHLDWCK